MPMKISYNEKINRKVLNKELLLDVHENMLKHGDYVDILKAFYSKGRKTCPYTKDFTAMDDARFITAYNELYAGLYKKTYSWLKKYSSSFKEDLESLSKLKASYAKTYVFSYKLLDGKTEVTSGNITIALKTPHTKKERTALAERRISNSLRHRGYDSENNRIKLEENFAF